MELRYGDAVTLVVRIVYAIFFRAWAGNSDSILFPARLVMLPCMPQASTYHSEGHGDFAIMAHSEEPVRLEPL